MSDLIQSAAVFSASVTIAPQDSRCRYWAKVIRKEMALPFPSLVAGANDIPGSFARNGDEELFSGDVLIEGEEVSHRKARGWVYRVTFVGADGKSKVVKPSSDIKAAMKAAGLHAALLSGSGDVAACVRIAHGLRAGLEEQIMVVK
jgi:hypothetical protein